MGTRGCPKAVLEKIFEYDGGRRRRTDGRRMDTRGCPKAVLERILEYDGERRRRTDDGWIPEDALKQFWRRSLSMMEDDDDGRTMDGYQRMP